MTPLVAEMQACEDALLHNDFSGRRSELEELLAADFVEVSASGLVGIRQSVVEWLLRKDPEARWQFRDMSVQAFAPDLRLVRYHAQQIAPMPSTGKGALHCSLWWYNQTLQRWQLRFHQSTKLA